MGVKNKITPLVLLFVCITSEAAWPYRNGPIAGEDCDDLSGMPIYNNMDFNTDILPLFNDYSCSSCHDGSDGVLNLSTNNGPPLLTLLGSASQQTGGVFIEPEFPELSYLFQKVNCQMPFDGVRMPATGAIMTLEDQGKIYDWIYQGALGEFPPGLWYRDLIFRNNLESLRD